ncbi:efflux RND transporter periplasmic adaptor subunit [Methylocella sp.]|uniref:efflux RND transporter periplasmic adaptor subunit n=1 Tax=Methylocella sp. TaxID=1978226 RepID=UPI0037845C9A
MNSAPPKDGFKTDHGHARQPDPGLCETARQEKSRRRLAFLLGAFALVAVGGLVAVGAASRASRSGLAAAAVEERRALVPTVRAATMTEVAAPRKLLLTGNMAPFESATIYARATGYIAERRVDIGSKVKKGDVLAVIAAPELDHQLEQAKAQLLQNQAAVRQAEASADLGKLTDQRTARLVAKGWSSEQQGDTDRLTLESRVAQVAVAKANVAAQEAAVNRLRQLTEFKQIVAPFDGVVTNRLIDVGSLVTADAASGTPLFQLARADKLRVQVFAPQSAAFGLKDGDPAKITVAELPGRVFAGRVARNAAALSPGTRTLLVEIDVDNADGILSPGLYSLVELSAPRPYSVVVVPSQAVIFGKDGLQVAVIRDDGTVELRKIDVAQDNGATLDVRAGLKTGERIILSPPANAANGMKVEAAAEVPQKS